MFNYLRHPTRQQSLIWLRRRQKDRPTDIARELGVSRPFVSQAQRIAESRIAKLLLNAASINRIRLKHVSGKYGIAIGYCSTFAADAYILYSTQIGVQTWFLHEGDCVSCEEQSKCLDTLKQLAVEWGITYDQNLPPTKLGLFLVKTMERRIGWETKI